MDSRTEEQTKPRTVDEARSAVEQSRQRISNTLDALEDRIVEKKQALQDKADVLRPVREQVEQRPFTVLAVAIGVGALLGSLGGEGDRNSRKRSKDAEGSLSEDDRAELREWRAHRRERLDSLRRDHEGDRHERGNSRLTSMKDQLMGAVTTAIGAAVTAKVKSLTSSAAGRDDGRDVAARDTGDYTRDNGR